MEDTTSLIKDDFYSPILKTHAHIKSSTPVFILCNRCYWCATYFGNTRIPTDNNCAQCNANSNQLARFPIVPNEAEKKRRILLVDDEPDTCMTFQTVLEDAGYECSCYTDSVKALNEFRPSYYNLGLVDIKMPVLNGFELCKKIRELDNNVQIIFITASEEYYEKSRSQYYRELLSNNDNSISYIQTPIGNQELIKMVNMTILRYCTGI